MGQPSLGGRYRDRTRGLGARYGDVSVGAFRTLYGPRFAPGCADALTLAAVLPRLDDHSLALLWRDYEGRPQPAAFRALQSRPRRKPASWIGGLLKRLRDRPS